MRQDADSQHFGPAWSIFARVGGEGSWIEPAHQLPKETFTANGQRGDESPRVGMVWLSKRVGYPRHWTHVAERGQIHRPRIGNFQFRCFQRMARQFSSSSQHCKFHFSLFFCLFALILYQCMTVTVICAWPLLTFLVLKRASFENGQKPFHERPVRRVVNLSRSFSVNLRFLSLLFFPPIGNQLGATI